MAIRGSCLIVLMVFAVSAHSQPQPRPGWPVEMGPETNVVHKDNLTWCRPLEEEPIFGFGSSGAIGLLTLNGEFLPGWPKSLWRPGEIFPIHVMGPKFGDLDGDGIPEIAMLEYDDPPAYRRLVFTFTGDTLHEYTLSYGARPIPSPGYHLFATPVFADLDDDGRDELFCLTPDSLYCFVDGGGQYPGFPYAANDTLSATQAGVVVGTGEGWPFEQPLICWGTYNGVHARFLGETDEVPGFPFSMDLSEIGLSNLHLFVQDGDWYLYMTANRQRHLITSSGEHYGEYPLPILNEHVARYYIAFGDYENDGVIDIFQPGYQGEVLVYEMDGSYKEGFPLIIEGGGGGGIDALLAIESSDTLLHFRNQFIWQDFSNWQVHMSGFHGSQMLPGFPYRLPLADSTVFRPDNPLAIIPRGNTLHLVTAVVPALLFVFDYELPEGMIVDELVWPMPGNTPGGNRFYSPRPSTLSVPPSPRTPDTPPESYYLSEPYPNPFNSQVEVTITLVPHQAVTVEVVDLLGRIVTREMLPAGLEMSRRWSWDGRSMTGEQVASGTYWIRLAEQSSIERKVVLLR